MKIIDIQKALLINNVLPGIALQHSQKGGIMKKIYFLLLFVLILSAYFPVEEVFARAGGGQSYEDNSRAADRESDKIIEAAKKYVEASPYIGKPCELKLTNRKDSWAYVNYMPIPFEGDPPGLLLEKVKGQWVVRACGTGPTEWDNQLSSGW